MTGENTNQKVELPAGVNMISILFMVTGVFWLIYPFFYMWGLAAYFQEYLGYIPWANVLVNTTCCFIGSFVIASLYFGVAGGMKKGMPMASMWAMILAVIALFNIPIGTILGIIILIYLLTDKDVKAWFEQGAAAEKEMMEQMQQGKPPQ